MKNINWQVRLKDPQTIMSIVSAILLIIEQILNLFGIQVEAAIGEQVMAIVQTALWLLVLLGVIQDPTTAGIKDSKRALTYTKPKKEVE